MPAGPAATGWTVRSPPARPARANIESRLPVTYFFSGTFFLPLFSAM